MKRVEVNYRVQTAQKYEAVFEKLAGKCAGLFKVKDLRISVAIVGPAEMKKLNKRYRSRDKVTDVLSFEEVNEIVICYAEVKKQARLFKHSLKQETARLFVHGLLHLLGFDHQQESDYLKMEQAAAKILA
jgi:probable rRNA maturation factor